MTNKKKHQEPDIYQDENFAFIAGYTPGGFPYGITWAEQEEIDRREREGRLPVEKPEGVDFSPEEAELNLEEAENEGKLSFDEVDITDLPF
jgi:uncharacterized protein YkuJ